MSNDEITMESDGSRPLHTVNPYPLYAGEDVADYLRSRQASEFPSRLVYPHPPGMKDQETKCGCLYTQWPDMVSQGVIRLETIWQPLWDTRDVSAGCVQATFFSGVQDPGDVGWGGWRGSQGKTNLYTPGRLPWPKKFHIWELELFLSSAELLEDGVVTIRIGEKDHLNAPLSLFLHRKALVREQGQFHQRTSSDRLFMPLPLPLFLPSIQNFGVSIQWGEPTSAPCRIRAVMNGYMHREIP